ncbi:MAG: hypothetical protein KF816_06375 [Melioribacteraceae bacterium]|nr:hypothetical protein [Melioribacteraceae bacterium]
MRYKCSSCGTIITKELKLLTDKNLISVVDGEDLIPSGYFMICDGTYFSASFTTRIIINKNDMINSKRHYDENRFCGCCGQDGSAGPNIICVNNHDIATELSDCWMSHGILLEPCFVKEDDSQEFVNMVLKQIFSGNT